LTLSGKSNDDFASGDDFVDSIRKEQRELGFY